MSDKRLYIIRGLPGSGKTTLAASMAAAFYAMDVSWLEADDWMLNADGHYCFDPGRLRYCHTACQDAVKNAMVLGTGNIIVSNTFTQCWEFDAYLLLAHTYGYTIQVIECAGDFGSVHGVPATKIEQMRRRWDRTDAVMKYIEHFNRAAQTEEERSDGV